MTSPAPPTHPPSPGTDAIETVLRVIAIGFCAGFSLCFLFSVFANYWPGPFVDYWIDIPNVEKYFNGTLTWHDLVSAHANVHRLFIPRLLFIMDYQFFAGTNTLLIGASLLCKGATLVFFNDLIKDQDRRTKWLLNILIFAAILNAANLSNVLHNSNMQWDLVSVFSCFAIYFYNQYTCASSPPKAVALGLAFFCFACGFLSQAGALPVLFVFIFISLLNKRWTESILGFIFMAGVFYLTFVVLPVNEPQNPTYETALATVVLKLKYVAIYVFKMFSGSMYFIDNQYFIFSWIMLLLFLFSLFHAHKTKPVYHNIFLHLALFAFLMMVTIAAARVDFAPKTWPANRYQTNVMLFILTLSLHAYFSIPVWFGNTHKAFLQNAMLCFSIASFLITQYFLSNYGAIFGNKVFAAQAYMLTHGVNQYNGADLLPSLHAENDRIAGSDAFFRQHGFAWYANKQAAHGTAKKTGEPLVLAADLPSFADSCSHAVAPASYGKVADGEGLQFTTTLRNQPAVLLHHMPRNTYYVLDGNGAVIGFAFLYIDPDHPYAGREIQGYVVTPSAKYLAETNHSGNTTCLYSFDTENESLH